jgi:hypothetical protein
MTRLVGVIWTVTALLIAGAAVGATFIAVSVGGDAVVNMTLAFGVMATLAALLATAVTAHGNRQAARHQEELAEHQREMAEDIRRLAELTESSLEEARAQRPEPFVFFVAGAERTPTEKAILERKRLARELDIDAIVAAERQRALAAMPQPKRVGSTPEQVAGGVSLGQIQRIAEMGLLAMGGGVYTEEELSAFHKRVDEYAGHLRDWLTAYETYQREVSLIFRSDLRFENRGRVPATDVRVQLRFPDAFQAVEDYPELEERPDRPRPPARGLAALPGLATPDFRIPHTSRYPMITPPIRGNVSAPRYRRGSLVVEYEIDKLLHGVPEETDEPIMLRIEEDGRYEIPWEVHAENLAEPATGTLVLEVVTEKVEGAEITRLEELTARAEPETGDTDE